MYAVLNTADHFAVRAVDVPRTQPPTSAEDLYGLPLERQHVPAAGQISAVLAARVLRCARSCIPLRHPPRRAWRCVCVCLI